MKPVVVKLGGSLAEAGTLRSWASIVANANRPLVIVPGGGPCAEAVRNLQAQLLFSDDVAHDMAILAMEQVGHALISLEPRFVGVSTLEGLYRAKKARRLPVWLPAKMCATDRRIPRDWSITSDGLAARLAERLATDVALIKSTSAPATLDAHGAAEAGLVDIVFAEIVERSSLGWCIFGPQDQARFADFVATSGDQPRDSTVGNIRPLPSTRPRHHARAR